MAIHGGDGGRAASEGGREGRESGKGGREGREGRAEEKGGRGREGGREEREEGGREGLSKRARQDGGKEMRDVGKSWRDGIKIESNTDGFSSAKLSSLPASIWTLTTRIPGRSLFQEPSPSPLEPRTCALLKRAVASSAGARTATDN